MSIRQRRSISPQNQTPWKCPCGQTVHGNGGQASHKRTCRTWAETVLANVETAIARIDAGDPAATPRRRRLDRMFYPQLVRQRTQLRRRLGLAEGGTSNE